MFEPSSASKNSFLELNSPLSPYNNQPLDDLLHPFSLPKNSNLALWTDNRFRELAISGNTDTSGIPSVQAASNLVQEKLANVALSSKHDPVTGWLLGNSYNQQIVGSKSFAHDNLLLNAAPATPVDNAGNTLGTANNIGTLSSSRSFSDWVGSADTNDYYRFSLGTQSNFSLTLNGLTNDADVELIQDVNNNGIVDSGDVLQSSTNGGTTAETISRTLNAGTYFARVFPYSGDTNYNLSLGVIPDNAGNTLATANNIGTLSGSRSFSDWVGSADTNDYYRFSLGTQSNFTLTLNGLTNDADVELIQDVNNNGIVDSGDVLQSSTNGGTTAETISRTLNAGSYFARVFQYSGDTNYNLSLNATSVVIPDNAGNTLATANNIGTLSGSRSFSDWVGSTDTNDYYRFAIGTQSNFSLTLNGLTNDADVELIQDVNNNGIVDIGDVLQGSYSSGATADTISRTLNAGTYFARVFPYSGDTNYNLSLNATSVVIPDNAGNTLATANNIGTLSGSRSFSDWVGSTDTNDYYRFAIGTQSNFTLTLNGLTNDADVQLIQDVNNNGIVDSGDVLQSSTNGGTTAETISRTLNAGTYFARVFPYSGDTNYNLSLNATPVDNAGNTLATANNIGTLSGSRSFSDWVGSTDTNDYYRFSIGTQSNFSLTLNGLSGNADVQLIQDINNNGIVDSGDVLQSSSKTGTTADTISRTLNIGNYFVRVYPTTGVNTNYNLTLNAAGTPLPDNAGNTLATARNDIGTLNGSRSFGDWVGSTDTNDYYRFAIGTQSNFSLTLNGLSGNADVQLIQDVNNNGIVDSGDVLQSSTNSGTTAETISRSLNAGTYFVRVYPTTGVNTNYNLTLSATIPGDWYSQNLRDAELVNLTRSLASDGNLSRNDMISIFRNAEDGNVIDANELTDLRTIVSNSTRFTMADSVKVLSNKIANSDPANTKSTIGNLFAGSSTAQMESLIGKWFLGNSRPSTSYSYQYVSGSLFQNGISANDIDQNALGDCYYLATLSSIAQEKPSYIQDMFIDNGDDTFSVRFYNNGVTDYVTVDRYLPTSGSRAIYAGWGGGSSTSSTNELWVALAEKAYAQLAESGWSRPSSPNNSYSAIEGGWMDTVIRQVTGLAATSQSVNNMTQTQLINLVNSNQILTAGFVNGAGFGVVNGHAYTITSYNSTNQTFHLRNPWGTNDADVTFAQLQSLSAYIQWSNT